MLQCASQNPLSTRLEDALRGAGAGLVCGPRRTWGKSPGKGLSLAPGARPPAGAQAHRAGRGVRRTGCPAGAQPVAKAWPRPIPRPPGRQPPGRRHADRVHRSGAWGLPWGNPCSQRNVTAGGGAGPHLFCPSLSRRSRLLSGKAVPLSPAARRAPSLPREGAVRSVPAAMPGACVLSGSSALTAEICFFPKPHPEQRELCVAPSSLAHGGLFYDSV